MAEQVSAPRWERFCSVPQRIILALLGFMGMINMYAMRVCLSVAITKMVKPHNITRTTDNAICPKDSISAGSTEHVGGNYDWSETVQGFILSSFYIGYVLSHLPGGWLADKFGGKWVYGLGILITGIATVLIPPVVYITDAPGLIGLRALMGFAEGVTFPAMNALLAHWVPAKQRSTYGAFVLGGVQVGSIVGNFLSGVLLHSYSWEIVFYFFGVLAALWFIPYVIFVYSKPSLHPFITDKERAYLTVEIEAITEGGEHLPLPWKSMLKSGPIWGLIVAQIGHDWGFYIVITELPKYFANVLQISVIANGFFTALPFLATWILSIIAAVIADVFISRKILSVTVVRKVMSSIGDYCSAIFMLFAIYAQCEKALVIGLFTIAICTMGAYYAGLKVNPLDLSPNHAGMIMAIVNGVGGITGILVPIIVGALTPDTSLSEWMIVFWLTFAIRMVTSTVYIIFGSGKVQAFNEEGIEKLNLNK